MGIRLWQIWGAVFTLVFGTVLHFTYGWSDRNPLVALFSPVNESTWEHMKLLITPILLFGIVEYACYGKDLTNFIPVKALSLLVGMGTTVLLFYAYTLALGTNYLPADIATFVAGVVAAYWFSAHFLQTDAFSAPEIVVCGWLLLILILLYSLSRTLREI